MRKASKKKNSQQMLKELVGWCRKNEQAPVKEKIRKWNIVFELASKLDDTKIKAEAADKLFALNFGDKKHQKALEFVDHAIVEFLALNNKQRVVQLEGNKGVLLLQLSKFKAATTQFKKALDMEEATNDNKKYALKYLGLSYYYLGDYEQALTSYKKTADLFDKGIDDPDLASLYNMIGMLYKSQTDYPKALEYMILSTEIATRLQLDKLLANNLNNLGGIYVDLDRIDKALDSNLRSLEIYDKLDMEAEKASGLTNVGAIYSRRGKYDLALKFYENSLNISRKYGNEFILSSTLNNIGALHYKMKNHTKAIPFYKEALEYKVKVSNKDGIYFGNKNLAIAYMESNEPDKALEFLKKSLEIAEEIKNDNYIYLCYNLYSDIYKKKKSYKVALDYYEKYEQLKNEVFKREKTDKIAEMQVRFETQQKERETELLKSKNDELAEKNKQIAGKNNELQDAIVKLHESEIKYNIVTEELEKSTTHDFIGKSKAIKEIKKLIILAARSTKINVLITGESGTGKEVVARNIHKLSSRNRHNFYAVNTSAIPESLFESQMFGHEKNAFTGAKDRKIGWFEIADHSTLFLDEIGTLPYDLQVKLLRVLEERKIVRVGSHQELDIDVRIISATNIDLLERVRDKMFRIDLYHRLATYVINIPPLRERKEDIPILLRHFIQHFSKRMNKPISRVDDKLEKALMDYDFPGNVRELKNMVERAVLVSSSSTLKINCFHIPEYIRNICEQTTLLSLDEVEKQQIIKALEFTGYHQKKAADLLKVNRKVIERRMQKYNIRIPKKR